MIDYIDAYGKGWIGPYLGQTTTGRSEPTFFSPHVPMAHNRPPTTVILGSPGGGKSFSAFTLTCQMAMQGAWIIYIDPKADAKPLANLKGMGHVNLVDMAKGEAGILNPFTMSAELPDQMMDALETIGMLIGDIPSAVMGYLDTILRKVAQGPSPSLTKVVTELKKIDNDDAQGVAGQLNLMSGLSYSRLCFGESTGATVMNPQDGLVVVTLLGLDLPPESLSPSDYSLPNRLAVTVMYLITSFTRRLLVGDGSAEHKRHPKAVVIDEAWALLATSSGRKVIEDLARLGRSLNTATVLVSQNAHDFMKSGIMNSVSTIMSFRMNSTDEAEGVLRFMKLPESHGNIDRVTNLSTGECLMLSASETTKKVTTVQVSNWNTEWTEAFDTNPETAGRREERKQEQEAAF